MGDEFDTNQKVRELRLGLGFVWLMSCVCNPSGSLHDGPAYNGGTGVRELTRCLTTLPQGGSRSI